MTFDISTAMQLAATMSVIIGVGLGFAVRGYPQDLQYSIRLWVIGLLLQPLPYLLLALRGQLPEFLSVLVSNVFLALGYAYLMHALAVFNRRPDRSRALAALLVGLVIAELLSIYIWPDRRIRVMSFSLVIAAIALYGALAIYRKQGRLSRAEHMLAGFLVAGVGLMAARVFDPSAMSLDSMSTASPMLGILFTYAALLPVIATTGFVLMCGERLNDDLGRLATLDPLTGACNRRTLATLAERAINEATRARRPLSLLVLDVDHFKRINDEFGHEAGDIALCALADLLRSCLREKDVISRIGGEEFAILLPDTDEDQARVIAERMRQLVAETGVDLLGKPSSLNISVGVSKLSAPAPDLGALLRTADRALYAAKRGGRNRVVAVSQMEALASVPVAQAPG